MGRSFATGLLALFLFLPLRAHNVFTSWTDAFVHPDRIELEFTLSRTSALRLVEGGDLLPSITPENFAEHAPRLAAVAGDLFQLEAAGRPLALTSSRVKISGEDDVMYTLVYPRPAAGPLRIFGNFVQYLVDGHVGTLVVQTVDGTKLGWSPISFDQPSFTLALPAPGAIATAAPMVTASFTTFLRLGIHHILIGFDHLLFLFGLLIACRRFATMAGIITCFTLAHSITLGLAAFDVVTMPPRIVEPLIAATIVFVGVENLLMRGREPKGRWILAFAFGLVHGFGFAGALKEVGQGLAGRALAMPLFSFNLGVELGQIAVAAVCLPLLFALRRREKFELFGPPVVSSLVAVAGGYWLLQRTVLS